jgi:tetratricopeptide (TPR) repeat protein
MEKNDLLLSGALSFMNENFQASVEAFSRLISLNQASEGYLCRATAFIRLGKYEEALKDLLDGEKNSNNSYEFSYKRGIALFYLERFQEAHESFVRAALTANTAEERSNLDLWMSKTKLECPNVTSTTGASQNITNTEPVVQTPSNPVQNNTTIDSKSQQATKVQTGTSSSINQYNCTHEWNQNPNNIFVTLNVSGQLDSSKVDVVIEKRSVSLRSKESNTVLYDLHLCNSIEPKQSTFEFKGNVVSLNLRKEIEGFNWVTLEREKVREVVSESKIMSSYPTSSKVKKNWDQIDKDLDKEMADNPESNEAMMNLFKQIYEKGDEKTRAAMKKSFQTSGGTVLSTNWDEVREKDYEGKDRPEPPKGQEWAKY